ncbi:MAG: type IV secretory system conjugative DNA transfer family protein [Chloroflexota bacterium]
MSELAWCDCFPPRDLTLADLTGMVRVLAGRPRQGVQRLTPLVALEVQLSRDQVRWLLGMDTTLARSLPAELQAQLPGLGLVPITNPHRPVPTTARDVRCDRLSYALRTDTARAVAAGVLHLAGQLGKNETATLQLLIGPAHGRSRQPAQFNALEALGLRVPATPDAGQQQAWKQKRAEPLFGVRGRIGATASTAQRAGVILRLLLGGLSLANGPHARMRSSRQSSRTAQQLANVVGRVRTWSSLLNAAELAVLMCWPVDGLEVPGQSVGFAAPPSVLLRSDRATSTAGQERLLGTSTHPVTRGAVVQMPFASYAAHCHVAGPSGVGKSTLLANWVLQEAEAGRSALVVEPKGDLAADVLSRISARRHSDIVVIDPGARGPVVGFNPLAGASADAERRADSLLHLFRELFGTAIGPRSSDTLLHTLIMAARLDDGALTDVPAILTNAGFRRKVLAKVSDPLIVAPWAAWFDGLSEAERGQVVAPVMNKLRALVSRPAIRRLLGQSDPRFSFDELFRAPKIVLVNLNAGASGQETVKLIGSLVLNHVWEAVQRQTTVPIHQRREVAVFVDEWQDFTTGLDFADVLARARGAKVSFTVAHQHLGQLSPDLRAAVLANARSRVVFRPADGTARRWRGYWARPSSRMTSNDCPPSTRWPACWWTVRRACPLR